MFRHRNLARKLFSLIFILLAGLSISSAAPSIQDSSRAAAEKLIAEAEALTEKRTEQSYQQAIEKYLSAVSIWRSLNDKPMEAATLYEAGWLYGDIGQYQNALDCYSQALTLYKALGNHKSIANTLNNTAWIYGDLGESQTALDLYLQAAEAKKKIGEMDAVAISNVASSYAQLGQYQRALDMHLQVVALRQGPSDKAGRAITLSNIGNSYYHLGDVNKALDFYTQSLELMRQDTKKYYTAAVLNHMGVAYRSLGEYDKALNYFNEALELRRIAGDHRGIATTLSDIARLERDRGNLLEARRRIEEALAQVEVVRSKVSSSLLRSSFFASVQQYREFYIDLLMRLQKDNPSEQLERVAFNASETGRARSLLQLLAEAGSNIHHGIDPSLLERKRALAETIDAKAQQQMNLVGGKHTDEEAESVRRELSGLTNNWRVAFVRVVRSSPRSFSRCRSSLKRFNRTFLIAIRCCSSTRWAKNEVSCGPSRPIQSGPSSCRNAP